VLFKRNLAEHETKPNQVPCDPEEFPTGVDGDIVLLRGRICAGLYLHLIIAVVRSADISEIVHLDPAIVSLARCELRNR
jgi:hypothetical protein